MFDFSADGTVMWANSQCERLCLPLRSTILLLIFQGYEMTGHSRDSADHCPMSLYSIVAEEDHSLVDKQFEMLTVEKTNVRFEHRVKKTWINSATPQQTEETTWLLCMAFPDLNSDGSLKSILGCTADISQLKWAESLHKRSRLEAEEGMQKSQTFPAYTLIFLLAKASQERFMDITSSVGVHLNFWFRLLIIRSRHEMRNPLSAILQSADGIANDLLEYQALKRKTEEITHELIESNLEAAQIIILCAQHQQRIINDVLTLSKLDSAMLSVSPVVTQPMAVVQGTLQMFKGELLSNGIGIETVIEKSFIDLQLHWFYCDPSRLKQVLINILTNVSKLWSWQSLS